MNTNMKKMIFAGLAVVGMSFGTASAAVWGPELAVNGNMESGNPPNDWPSGSAFITRSASSDTPDASAQSLRIDMNYNKGGLDDAVGQNYWDPTAGTYKYEFDYKVSSDGLYATVSLNGGGGSSFGFSGNATEWTHVTNYITFTSNPPTVFSLLFYPANGTPSSTQTIWIDNVSLKQEVVPEPASFTLIGLSALGLLARRRRR